MGVPIAMPDSHRGTRRRREVDCARHPANVPHGAEASNRGGLDNKGASRRTENCLSIVRSRSPARRMLVFFGPGSGIGPADSDASVYR